MLCHMPSSISEKMGQMQPSWAGSSAAMQGAPRAAGGAGARRA